MYWYESQIAELVSLADQYVDHRRALSDESAAFDYESDTHRGELALCVVNPQTERRSIQLAASAIL